MEKKQRRPDGAGNAGGRFTPQLLVPLAPPPPPDCVQSKYADVKHDLQASMSIISSTQRLGKAGLLRCTELAIANQWRYDCSAGSQPQAKTAAGRDTTCVQVSCSKLTVGFDGLVFWGASPSTSAPSPPYSRPSGVCCQCCRHFSIASSVLPNLAANFAGLSAAKDILGWIWWLWFCSQ